jgi:SAM-dependent methyltransferase
MTTDRATLAGDAYADDRHLSARQALYAWQHPRHDLPGDVLAELAATRGVVADVGCGNGFYLRRIRAERPDLHTVGIDIAPGIVRELVPNVLIADVQRLPFADSSVRAVLAMHMLYHVPDVDAAIVELRRVLAPGGVAVVSTNSRDDKRELDELWLSAAGDVLGRQALARVSLSSRFHFEDAGPILRRHFPEVRVMERRATIEMPSPEPVIRYLASYRTWAARKGFPFDRILECARQRVADVIANDGRYTIQCLAGMFVCRKPGALAQR